ncbi:MAG: DNA polymerase I, partial [Acutalibacteraceae bacterium]
EADDLIGTLSKSCKDAKCECFIATGDRDSFQLIGGGTKVLLASTKNGQPTLTITDENSIFEKYGVKPIQMIDIKAIQGDASDNIPGVAGIGEKGAAELISKFGSVKYIYDNIENLDIRDTLKAKLIAGKDSAFLSYELGKICLDAPIDTHSESYKIGEPDKKALAALLRKLQFKKFLSEWGLDTEIAETAAEETKNCEEPAVTVIFSQENPDEILSKDELGIIFENCAVYASFDNKIEEISDGTLIKIIEKGIKIRTNDSKYIFRYALDGGISVPQVIFDTSLAGYLLDPSKNDYGLLGLMNDFEIRVRVENEQAEYVYAAAGFDALCKAMIEKIREHGQEKLLFETEIPLSRVLANMERDGFLCDIPALSEYGERLEEEISGLCEKIYGLVGYTFNLNSPKQLGEALFDKLGLKGKKKTKNGYSTDAATLEKLKYEHPAVEYLLRYRTLAKLKSTYCDGLKKVAGDDGRIHSTFNQTETRTGRISSSEPNLQNIPVRKDEGRVLRKFFAAKDGCLLIDADYSQIELRVLADIADDKAMINAFKSGVDIHTLTASEVFSMPIELVTPIMRSRAKAVNFGIVYGIGAFSLAQDTGISFSEAKTYIENYYKTYPGVAEYMDRVVRDAEEKGYCETLFHRRRYLPELLSSNRVTKAFGERVARNAPIQGTAADIIKIAMVRVFERLEKENLKSRLILQVHDELIVEAPENEAQRVEEVVKYEMENAVKMKVELSADVHSGRTWYEAKQ